MVRVTQVFKHSNGYVQIVKLSTGNTNNSGEGYRIKQECFYSPRRKHKRNELVQNNSVIFGKPCVGAPWRSAP